MPAARSAVRRALDSLYSVSGALAAICLAAICALMLAQAVGRGAGILIRGADGIVAWPTAACAFLALGHTFRKGELVRVGLWLEMLGTRARWWTEVLALSITLAFVGYMAWAVTRFVLESWRFNEMAQGLVKIPIWIPQASLVVGMVIFFIAIADELIAVLQGRKPAYQIAEEERRAAGDFTETA